MDLNIIAFDVPYPPDYGGVIDIYYKLKSLHEAGVSIHLHCFEYGRQPREELNNICASVHYYPRRTTKSFLFNTLPYIVLSRNSDSLKSNLLKNNFPILMEGLHCTCLLNDDVLATRKIIVRAHNIEHDYYENLAKVESNIFKRYYFYNEAGKLKKYEAILKKATAIAAISPNDTEYFSSHYKHAHYIPAFHPYEKVTSAEGKGKFAFYHGNLAVGENNEAALFLVNKVFHGLKHNLIIAGSKPSAELQQAVESKPNIKLLSNVSMETIQEHIGAAHCNVLPTFQSTGIKLKLLAALFSGRFCIANKQMIENTGLESLCVRADSAEEMKEKIKLVFEKDFPQSEVNTREKLLMENFSNQKNAKKLLKILF